MSIHNKSHSSFIIGRQSNNDEEARQFVDCGEDIKEEIKPEVDLDIEDPISVESDPKAETSDSKETIKLEIKEEVLEDNIFIEDSVDIPEAFDEITVQEFKIENIQ